MYFYHTYPVAHGIPAKPRPHQEAWPTERHVGNVALAGPVAHDHAKGTFRHSTLYGVKHISDGGLWTASKTVPGSCARTHQETEAMSG